MKRLLIIFLAADIILSAIFIPWGMLFNALFLILAFFISFPILYYRLYLKDKK